MKTYLTVVAWILVLGMIFKAYAYPPAKVTLKVKPHDCPGGTIEVNSTPYLTGDPAKKISFSYPPAGPVTVAVPGPVEYFRLTPCTQTKTVDIDGVAIEYRKQKITFTPETLATWSRYEVFTQASGSALAITSQQSDGYLVNEFVGEKFSRLPWIDYLILTRWRFTPLTIVPVILIAWPLIVMTLMGLKNRKQLILGAIGMAIFGGFLITIFPWLQTLALPESYSWDGIIGYGPFSGYPLAFEQALFWLILMAPILIMALIKKYVAKN